MPETIYSIPGSQALPQQRVQTQSQMRTDEARRTLAKKCIPKKAIHHTSDDLILIAVCRYIHRMSWTSIARILNTHYQQIIDTAVGMGIYKLEDK